MKTKTNRKELTLKKATVSNLNEQEMIHLKGGNLWDTLTEPSVDPRYC